VNKITNEFIRWFNYFIILFPGGVGVFLRRFIYKLTLSKVGKNLIINNHVEMTGIKNINLGNNNQISSYCTLNAHDEGLIFFGNNIGINRNTHIGAANGGKIIVGNNVMIAQNVVIRASGHGFKSLELTMDSQDYEKGTITIGDDCWIGANSVILKNVKIGNKSIVAAGSVVTKDIPDFSVYGGVPATFIKMRK
jgi:galactoside O-acetyltransferase